MQITPLMHAALTKALAGPLRRVHNPELNGPPVWPAHPLTLHALEQRGHLSRSRIKNAKRYPVDLWTITDTGRQALQPAERFRTEPILYLADRRMPTTDWSDPGKPERHDEDYTGDKRRSIDPLPTLGDPADTWLKAAARRHADAQDRRQRARDLASRVQAA